MPNNDLGHVSRSRISNMETESQNKKLSAKKSAATEAYQLPDVSQGDQMFQQNIYITDNKRFGSSIKAEQCEL